MHIIRKAWLALVPGTLIVLSACSVFHSRSGPDLTAVPSNLDGPPGSDSLLVKLALLAFESGDRAPQIWRGFWPPPRSFLIYDPGRAAILVSETDPGSGFVALTGDSVPEALRGRSYIRRGTLPGFLAAYEPRYSIGKSSVVAVSVEGYSLDGTLGLLFHETFHQFQRSHFSTRPSKVGFVDPREILHPSFEAMCQIERDLLYSALSVPPDSLGEVLRAYLAVRHRRLSSVRVLVGETERALERLEGSAKLVDLYSVAAARSSDNSTIVREIGELLQRPLNSFPGEWGERLLRWRLYGTGAAIGYVLDRMGIDWHAELERGAGFDELLARAAQFDTASSGVLADSVLSRFRLEELETAIAVDSTRYSRLTMESFLALDSVRLVVELRYRARIGEASRLNWAGAFTQIDSVSRAIPMAEYFRRTGPGATLLVRKRPVLSTRCEGAPSAYELGELVRECFVIMVPVKDIVVRGQTLGDGEYRYPSLHLDHHGVEITIQETTTVRVNGKEILIRQGRG